MKPAVHNSGRREIRIKWFDKPFRIPLFILVWILPIAIAVCFGTIYRLATTPDNFSRSSKSLSEIKQDQENSRTDPANSIPLLEAFDGPDRIYVNEYAHWNPGSVCPYVSDIWDMTSGSLFIKDGVGYSGVPTTEKSAKCESGLATNSDVFRLKTRKSDYGDQHVAFDIKLVAHSKQPSTSFDGVHAWLHLRSESALYAVSFGRWDGTFVIKKKIPVNQANCTDQSNGGCYVTLGKPVSRSDLITPQTWRHIDIYVTHSQSDPEISLFVDGELIVTAVDADVSGPAYSQGSFGLRADNTEFYIKEIRSGQP